METFVFFTTVVTATSFTEKYPCFIANTTDAQILLPKVGNSVPAFYPLP